MAIWQTAIRLYCKGDKNHFDDEKIKKSIKKLSVYFPEESSWCERIRQFGNVESTCIELIYDNIETANELVEISVRLDLRSITEEHLQSICTFARENNLLIGVCEDFYDPSIDGLKEIIKKSDAYKFITNPESFIRNIKT